MNFAFILTGKLFEGKEKKNSNTNVYSHRRRMVARVLHGERKVTENVTAHTEGKWEKNACEIVN